MKGFAPSSSPLSIGMSWARLMWFASLLLLSGPNVVVCVQALKVISPTDNGMVIGNSVRIIVQCHVSRVALLLGNHDDDDDYMPQLSAQIQSQPATNATNANAALDVTTTDYAQLNWTRLAYRGRFVADVPLKVVGSHSLVLSGRCGRRRRRRPLLSSRLGLGDAMKLSTRRLSFDNSRATTSVAVADTVIAEFMRLHKPTRLIWNWGPAIFLYPLTRLAAKSTYQQEYLDYVARYNEHHMNVTGLPSIKYADECPPALSSFTLAAQYQDGRYWPNVERVVQWIEGMPRNELDSIDHVGDQLIGKLVYPSSIWVDSLVMWGLLTTKYGLLTNHTQLLSFGLEQPLLFYNTLLDKRTGLLHHAWNVEQNEPLPRHNVPWLRGNGWALMAMAETLTLLSQSKEYAVMEEAEAAGMVTNATTLNVTRTKTSSSSGRPNTRMFPSQYRYNVDTDDVYYTELATKFVSLANAALQYRQASGYWDTVMAQPGYAYEESSGSALVAAAFSKGVRLGLLPNEFLTSAKDTFAALTARLQRKRFPLRPLQGNRENRNLFVMTDISIGTNPSGRMGYKVLPTRGNINYGVGAFLLLADELSDVNFYA